MRCFFASDLHGSVPRYEALFGAIAAERPRAVFLGGDLFPHPMADSAFVERTFLPGLARLAKDLGPDYPEVFTILGNDDPRTHEAELLDAAGAALLTYAHARPAELPPFTVVGYAYVPPTPFMLKDWERYDVSRYVPPACTSPEEGLRTIPVGESEARWSTIAKDLEQLSAAVDTSRTIFLFHAPPSDSALDRAALDGRMIDHVPLDVNVGSIAMRRFIEREQPLLTLHGHVHESVRLTGAWRETIGRTWIFGAAHDGPELALVRFDPEHLEDATRELIGGVTGTH